MEQMTNLRLVSSRAATDAEGPSPWRSFDSVVSALLMRAEARQGPGLGAADLDPVAAAWAAE